MLRLEKNVEKLQGGLKTLYVSDYQSFIFRIAIRLLGRWPSSQRKPVKRMEEGFFSRMGHTVPVTSDRKTTRSRPPD